MTTGHTVTIIVCRCRRAADEFHLDLVAMRTIGHRRVSGFAAANATVRHPYSSPRRQGHRPQWPVGPAAGPEEGTRHEERSRRRRSPTTSARRAQDDERRDEALLRSFLAKRLAGVMLLQFQAGDPAEPSRFR